MSKFDRYVLSQLLVLFGFFALVLVAVFWINRAVRLFEQLMGDGQTTMVFLEFTALSLPNLIKTVVPMAVFAASTYVTNRLNSESELTVMQATGTSPWRLARPVVLFGLLAAAMMTVLTTYLVPASLGQLDIRQSEISRNVTARLLSEGEFLHPAAGVTFYVRQIDDDGTLRDVFLSDHRRQGQTTTYTASEAYLVRQGDATNLIMVDGLAQQFEGSSRQLSTAKFADFSYNVEALVKQSAAGSRSAKVVLTSELFADPAALSVETGETEARLNEELNTRFALPLFCLVAALLGFCTLLVGGYSRFGVWREVVIAFGLLISLEVLRSVATDMVRSGEAPGGAVFVPTLIGLIICMGMLAYASRPALFQRRRPRGGVTP